MQAEHWTLTYADRTRYGDSGRYVITDGKKRVQYELKIDAIVAAQVANGYTPVDGSEGTLRRQLLAEGNR